MHVQNHGFEKSGAEYSRYYIKSEFAAMLAKVGVLILLERWTWAVPEEIDISRTRHNNMV